MKLGQKVIETIDELMEEFVFESEMYVIPEYELRMAEEFLDQYEAAMRIFVSQSNAIDWLEETDGEETLVIMPHLITEVLEKKLFSKKFHMSFLRLLYPLIKTLVILRIA